MSFEKNNNIIKAYDLKKYFGEIKAVDGVSFQIQKGEIFSLLGPNGAGKTTCIRMMTTVLTPDNGDVLIAGHSIKTDQAAIRELIGVCPQEIVIYDELKAEENATFVAQMHNIPRAEAKRKASALLEKMGIAGRKDKVKHFSGGMKRRLNLIMALVHEPKIAFLDEPTAGLDPQARRIVWDFIHGLRDAGMTVVLTTHDMVEADAVSDHIAIIDYGKIIAQGTPDELKEQFGSGNVAEIGFFEHSHLETIKETIESLSFITKITAFEDKKLLITFSGGLKNFIKVLKQGIIDHTEQVDSLRLRQSSLEDVFLHLTGRKLRDE